MNKFDRMMGLCKRLNPSSLTSRDSGRVESVTRYGLDLVPKELAASLEGRPVLILGCGDGYEVAYAYKKFGWAVQGVTYLDEEYQGATLIHQRDMHDLQLGMGTFDFVYSKETLEHSPCPILALLEINRVLSTNGQFFHLIPDGWEKQRDWYHFSCFPEWLWCDLHRKAGMIVEQVLCWPDTDHLTLGNKGYLGRKVEQVTLGDSMEDWRNRLGFEHCALKG